MTLREQTRTLEDRGKELEQHNKLLIEQARALEEQARETEQIYIRQNQEKNALIDMTNKEKYEIIISQFLNTQTSQSFALKEKPIT